MQIGRQLITNYDNHIQDNIKLEQSEHARTELSGLKEGSVFRGEVVELNGDKVTIALESSGNITAKLQAELELCVGDQLLFSVKENSGSQILIKPVFDSLQTAQMQVLEKALDHAGLSPTEKNFTVAKELMEAGMPVDKGNMVKLLSQSMKFPDTPIQTLTSLNKLNIPVTEENITQYGRYQEYNHQLANDISQVVDSMADFARMLPDSMNGRELFAVANDLMEMFFSTVSDETGQSMPNQQLNQNTGVSEHMPNIDTAISDLSQSVESSGLQEAMEDHSIQWQTDGKATGFGDIHASNADIKNGMDMGNVADTVSETVNSEKETSLQRVDAGQEQGVLQENAVRSDYGTAVDGNGVMNGDAGNIPQQAGDGTNSISTVHEDNVNLVQETHTEMTVDDTNTVQRVVEDKVKPMQGTLENGMSTTQTAAGKGADTTQTVDGKGVDTAQAVARKGADTTQTVTGKETDTTQTVVGKGTDTTQTAVGKETDTAQTVVGKGTDTAQVVAGKGMDTTTVENRTNTSQGISSTNATTAANKVDSAQEITEKESTLHAKQAAETDTDMRATNQMENNIKNMQNGVSDSARQQGTSPLATLFSKMHMPRQQLVRLLQSGQGIRELFESKEFKDAFADMIKDQFSIDPKAMKDAKEIDDLYEKITKQTKNFANMIAAKGGDTGQFQEHAQHMRQNMQFMEQLNQQMIYAQLPLKLTNQHANSELYVYADKRRLASKKDGISVMLHLDMEHLGRTDIKVTLTGTNVNARFYLNDRQSVEIVADNMQELTTQLKKRGFSLSDEVVMRAPTDSVNKVVDEIIDENAEQSIKRYTFDARM